MVTAGLIFLPPTRVNPRHPFVSPTARIPGVTENTSTPVRISTGVQPRPDGTFFATLTIETMMTAYAMSGPAEFFDQLATQLPQLLKDAAADARRQTRGILLATDLPNGHPLKKA